MNVGAWECNVCGLENDELDDACRDCRAGRPPPAQHSLLSRTSVPVKQQSCPQCGSAAVISGACLTCGYGVRGAPGGYKRRQRGRRR